MPTKLRSSITAVVFTAALFLFLNRGPYSALRFSTTADFSVLYGAVRCWLNGTDPYARGNVERALEASGAPAPIIIGQAMNPVVYLPSVLPWMAPFAVLPWTAANIAWCALSLLLFGWSLVALLGTLHVSHEQQFWVASAALFFSPTYVGVFNGNPSVISVSLTVLAICYALSSSTITGVLCLGIALCIKPQLAICAVVLLALWGRWRPLLAATGLFAAAATGGIVGMVKSCGWAWLPHLQQNLVRSFQPGGNDDASANSVFGWQLLNLQSLTAYLFADSRLQTLAAWGIVSLLASVYWKKRRQADPRAVHQWDLAFVATATLLITYHRYYDGQLLLLLLPLIVFLSKARARKITLQLAICLAIVAFPIQSVFAKHLGEMATRLSVEQFLLLRCQPIALVALTIILAWSGCVPAKLPETKT